MEEAALGKPLLSIDCTAQWWVAALQSSVQFRCSCRHLDQSATNLNIRWFIFVWEFNEFTRGNPWKQVSVADTSGVCCNTPVALHIYYSSLTTEERRCRKETDIQLKVFKTVPICFVFEQHATPISENYPITLANEIQGRAVQGKLILWESAQFEKEHLESPARKASGSREWNKI